MTTGVRPPELPPGWRLHVHEVLASSNDEALRLAREGAEEGTVVQALRQNAGRGRYGRRWISEAGNLHCSTVVRPRCGPAEAAAIGFVAAVAAVEAVDVALDGRRGAIKWPNDILIDGRKVAGILLEADGAADGCVAAMVVGIGINVTHAPALPGYPTTSLREAGGEAGMDAACVLRYLCTALHEGLGLWREAGFGVVRELWLARCAGLGGTLRVRTPAGEVSGRFAGLGDDGALLLESADGLRRVVAGDVLLGAG